MRRSRTSAENGVATPIMTEFKTNTYAGIEMKGMQRMVVIGAPNPWNSKKNPEQTYSKAIAFEA
jgi:hypothetical protein